MKQFSLPILLSILLLHAALGLHAQGRYKVKAKLQDSLASKQIAFATVAVFSAKTSRALSGTYSDENGNFEFSIDSAEISLKISYLGYKTKRIDIPKLEAKLTELGTIYLEPDVQGIGVVNVRAERSVVEFKLDKRVFNVGKDLSSTGLSALEVLNNVPSVNVDLEGQISLRGNSGVQVLINGKPSVLADGGGNAMGSITADMIESIEVVTNPSAKYEAEGTSGIINIILKKEEKKGINGSVSLNTGIPDNHSLGFSMNRRTEKFNIFTQLGGGYRSLPRYKESSNIFGDQGVLSEGIEFRNEAFINFTLGADYYINKLNVITLSGNYAYEFEDQPSLTEFSSFTDGGSTTRSWEREESTTAGNPKWQYDLQYAKEFKNNEDHNLLFTAQGRSFSKEQSSEFTNTSLSGNEADPNQQTETFFYQNDYTFKLDYTNPLSKKYSIEAGSMYEINDVGNDFEVRDQLDGEWTTDSGLTNNFEYDQKVLGLYGTAAYESERWGLKLGVRVENTDLRTVLTTTNKRNDQFYTNLFPSVHTSFKITPLISMQAGYSKRIFRPRLWDLNPFFNIRNNYNIRQGNPELLPEFADSYEFTAIFVFNKASLNTSVYHLFTTDVIERVTRLEEGINITAPLNIGSNAKTGLEITGKYTPVKWFSINGDFNYGYFNRRGTYEGQSFDFSSDQIQSKITPKFNLKADVDLECTVNYRSAYATLQGRRSGFTFLNFAARKKLWKGKTIINFAVNDVFASRIRESTAVQDDFSFYDFSMRGTFFTLGISYGFGKGEAMTYAGRRHH